MRLQRLFKKEEISWAAVVLEVFSVTLSVLVALAIGDWHEERQQRKQVEQVLQRIATESESNRQLLERRLSYYLALQKAIQHKIAEQGADAPAFPVEGWDGLKPALLEDSAYRTAIATNAFSHMDLALAEEVSQAYSFHDLYRFYLEKTVDRMFARGFENVGALQSTIDETAMLTRGGVKAEAQLSALIQKKMGRRRE